VDHQCILLSRAIAPLELQARGHSWMIPGVEPSGPPPGQKTRTSPALATNN